MTVNPYESPRTPPNPAAAKPWRLRITVVELLVVLGVLGVLMSLFLPNVDTAPRRPRTSNPAPAEASQSSDQANVAP